MHGVKSTIHLNLTHSNQFLILVFGLVSIRHPPPLSTLATYLRQPATLFFRHQVFLVYAPNEMFHALLFVCFTFCRAVLCCVVFHVSRLFPLSSLMHLFSVRRASPIRREGTRPEARGVGEEHVPAGDHGRDGHRSSDRVSPLLEGEWATQQNCDVDFVTDKCLRCCVLACALSRVSPRQYIPRDLLVQNLLFFSYPTRVPSGLCRKRA